MRSVLQSLRRSKRSDDSLTVGLHDVKVSLMDTALRRGVRSFADLGGVWAVDAGYTFYGLEHYEIDRACLVDTHITDVVRERARRHPQLELIDANFGDAIAVERVGVVDAVMVFDVLLHQVAPDWDEILRMYAPNTQSFLIVNPQLVGAARTTRLLDFGRDEYLAMTPSVPVHEDAWSKLDEVHPEYGRPYRDIHEIWQWGITDGDLERVMTALGFRCSWFVNGGSWFGLPRFENHAFLYVRETAT